MIRQRAKALLIAAVIMLNLCACGQNAAGEETSVKFQQDGTVVNTIIEDFDETLYNVDELKNMVLREVAAFNSNGNKVSVDKLEVNDNKVTVVMTYGGAGQYAEFNEKILFSGTVLEAYEQGLNLDITLTSTKKDGGQIGEEEILQLGDHGIIILEEPIKVVTTSKILYASDNVEILSAKTARVMEGTENVAYLIMK